MDRSGTSRAAAVFAQDLAFAAAATLACDRAARRLATGSCPALMRTSQPVFLVRSRWASTPALAVWMATANVVSIVAPTVALARQYAGDPVGARATAVVVLPIPAVLVVQAGLETRLGRRSDRIHPLAGLLFTSWRIHQVQRARRDLPPGHVQAPLLSTQRTFWWANVAMLVATVLGRSRMRPVPAERPSRGGEGRSRGGG